MGNTYARMLFHGKVDQKDKKITTLMALLGVGVPRQKVLWEFDFERKMQAVSAHNNYLNFTIVKLAVMREMIEEGEKIAGKWYETRRQILVTDFYRADEERGTKVGSLEKKMAGLEMNGAESVGSVRQRTMDEFYKATSDS